MPHPQMRSQFGLGNDSPPAASCPLRRRSGCHIISTPKVLKCVPSSDKQQSWRGDNCVCGPSASPAFLGRRLASSDSCCFSSLVMTAPPPPSILPPHSSSAMFLAITFDSINSLTRMNAALQRKQRGPRVQSAPQHASDTSLHPPAPDGGGDDDDDAPCL